MRTLLRAPLPLFALSFATAALMAFGACSSSGNDTDGPSGEAGGHATSTSGSTSTSGTTSTSSTGSTGSGGSGGSAPSCPPGPGGFGGNAAALAVSPISVTVHDTSDKAVSGLLVFLCGTDLCSDPLHTSAAGTASTNKAWTEKKPAVKFGDALTYPELGVAITTAAPTFTTLVTAPFPADGAVLAKGTKATSGDVTLTLDAAAQVVINTLVYDEPDKQKFRSVTLPADKEAQVLANSPGLDLLYGVAPTQTQICPSAAVTIPNDKGWTAGASVDFYIQSLDVGEGFSPYAGWARISGGTVSADGKTITTNPGEGFPVIETFGVRLTPLTP